MRSKTPVQIKNSSVQSRDNKVFVTVQQQMAVEASPARHPLIQNSRQAAKSLPGHTVPRQSVVPSVDFSINVRR